MTSPPRVVEVKCPGCGELYETFFRPSINLTLGEPWTAEEIEEATTGACPRCGRRVELGASDEDVERAQRRIDDHLA